jgi:hypothetical protein
MGITYGDALTYGSPFTYGGTNLAVIEAPAPLTFRNQLRLDRDAVFLNPSDFAEPFTLVMPDLATEIQLVGIWQEIDASEKQMDQDLYRVRFATVRCAAEALPTEIWACRFYHPDEPTVQYSVTNVVLRSQVGMAKIQLRSVKVESRHAREGRLTVRP